jgi:hypothetical protein
MFVAGQKRQDGDDWKRIPPDKSRTGQETYIDPRAHGDKTQPIPGPLKNPDEKKKNNIPDSNENPVSRD